MYDRNCQRCPLSAGPQASGGWVCLPGDGPAPADLLLYGEAPGENEEREGKPFIGQAGQLLTQCLDNAGMDRSSVYISNTTRCRPPGNRDPLPAEQDACRYYTVRELATVQPKVIVALGAKALRALTGKDKLGDNRTKLLPLLPAYRCEVPVVATYHPAAYLHQGRNQALLDNIVADLHFAQRVVNADSEPNPVITGPDAAVLAALRDLATCGVLGCDLEWEAVGTGKNPPMWPWSKRKGRTPRLVSIALAGYPYRSPTIDDNMPVVVAVPADTPAGRAALKLASRVPTVYHNAPSDLVWLLAVGARPVVAGDSLLLASLLNIPGSRSLETLATAYTTAMPWKAETQQRMGKRGQKTVGSMPVTEDEWARLLLRNGNDALVTLDLEAQLQKQVVKLGRSAVLPLYAELLRVSQTLARVTLAGVPIDHALLQSAEGKAKTVLDEARSDIARLLGVPGYATHAKGSDRALGLALEEATNTRLPRTPKTDEVSITKQVLIDLWDTHPVVPIMLRRSKMEKLHGTYLRPWDFLLREQGDGRLHTHYKLWNVRSGRTATEQEEGGSLHQFPRGRQVRRMVRARPGWKILAADLSQIELRIAAWLANEPTMIRFFNEGLDLHRATAGFILAMRQGLTLAQYLAEQDRWLAQVTKALRQAAKSINFGFLYGMREAKFITMAKADYGVDFTMVEAGQARDGYFTLYRGLVPWLEAQWQWVSKGYVDTPLGRRRPLVPSEGEDEQDLWRQAVNTPVQATGSDLGLLAMADIDDRVGDEALRDAALVIGFIHDAVLLEVRDDLVPYMAEVVRYAMEHPPLAQFGISLPVPLVADVSVGQTWGEGEEIPRAA